MRWLLLGAVLVVGLTVAPVWAATGGVTVANFDYSPSTIQIQPGDEVTWTFAGPDTNHSVTSESFDSDPGNASPFHAPGSTFSHTFASAGRFTYFCKVHSSMHGTVVVGDPGPAPDTTAPAVTGLEAKGGRKCKPRVKHCKPKPTRIAFALSEDARVRIAFTRKGGGKSPKALERDMAAGAQSVKLSTKRVPPGRYSLSLVATDAAGNGSAAATATVRVR